MQEIKIKITKQNKVTVTVNGVKGEGCKALTAAFEKDLGMVTSDGPTGEFYEQTTDQNIDQS